MDILSLSNSGNHGIVIEVQPNTGAYLGMNRRLRSLYRSPPGSASENDNYTSSLGQIQDNTDYIATITRDRSILPNGLNNIYLNGTILNETGYNLASISTSLASYSMTLMLGNLLPNNYARPLDGMVSEIIIFDRALKSDEISDIHKYLSKKYSIKIN